MSALKKCSFLLILLVLVFPAALFAQSIHIPPHETVVFKNGLTVLLLEKHGVPIVNFAALVKTGAAADPAAEEGLSAITAQLLRKGTQKPPAQQLAADSDFPGGSVEADASADFPSVSGGFLNKHLLPGLVL